MRTTRTERAHTPMAHSGTRARLPRLPATRNTEKSPSRPALAQPDASAHGGSNGADGGGCFCRDATEKRPAAHALARQNHAHIKSGSSITRAFAGRRAPRILTLTGSATLKSQVILLSAMFQGQRNCEERDKRGTGTCRGESILKDLMSAQRNFCLLRSIYGALPKTGCVTKPGPS